MPVIQQIYELKAPPILPTACFVDKKRKSHERPYKFHK